MQMQLKYSLDAFHILTPIEYLLQFYSYMNLHVLVRAKTLDFTAD